MTKDESPVLEQVQAHEPTPEPVEIGYTVPDEDLSKAEKRSRTAKPGKLSEKRLWAVPDLGVTVEATSAAEALEIAKDKAKENK